MQCLHKQLASGRQQQLPPVHRHDLHLITAAILNSNTTWPSFMRAHWYPPPPLTPATVDLFLLLLLHHSPSAALPLQRRLLRCAPTQHPAGCLFAGSKQNNSNSSTEGSGKAMLAQTNVLQARMRQ
jgi:hypothetical protein